ncbi:AEC family transporter [Georhizobium profundi]|uniref:AEC family transporter n=1 Tax=Georhizobium profundi TaxID=2341112 RepID=A0A3Q8XPP7_9HYPH|nr:AEC family transporter [Georhizobium profundi]AZN72310.1 AEC family transporter [Georhizobium profundi]
MIPILQSIIPIFLLVLLGVVLKRWNAIDQEFWSGLEQFGYFVAFPALLSMTLYQADFAALDIGRVALTVAITLGLMMALVLALWPIMQRQGITASSFTTIFQTGIRWNGFVALAIASSLHGAEGIALVALVMALIILPINLVCVAVMVWFGGGARKLSVLALRMVRNPLILSCLAGLGARHLPFDIPAPLITAIDLIGASALGLGLLMVGAGLRVGDALKPRPVAALTSAIKLVLFPLVMVAVALAIGIEGATLEILVLCAAVPTAMNGYLLARQMNGDAPLYAAITTIQTAASIGTMPLALFLLRQLSG